MQFYFWEAMAQVQSVVNHRDHTGDGMSGISEASGILRNNFVSGCVTVGTGIDPTPLTSLKAVHSPPLGNDCLVKRKSVSFNRFSFS